MSNKNTGWRRYSGWIVIAVLVVGGLFFGLRPQPVLVEAGRAQRGPLHVTIDEEGVTRVKDRFVISTPVAGYTPRIPLEVGDPISRGQVLAELEPLRSEVLDPRHRAEARARVAAARAALAVARQQAAAAQADADFAQQELARKSKLKDKNYVSEEALQQAESEARRASALLRSAHFSVDVARYDLQAAETALQYSAAQAETPTEGRPSITSAERVTLKSPVDGVVLAIHRKSEGVADAGTALLELGDPRALELAVDVLSFDAVQLESGMPVIVQRWGGDDLQGIVKLIEPVGFTKVSALGVEEQRVWVIVDLLSPTEEWQRLGDGYRVEARFQIWQGENVLQIPSSSLFRHGNQWAVFAIVDGRAQRRAVNIGRRNGLTTQITRGLMAGDRVITHPDSDLEHGSRVKFRE